MPYSAKLPVYRILARKEREYRRFARHQPVLRDRQPNVAARIFQARFQHFQRFVAAPSRAIHFRKIQIELRLIALHSNGRVAQSFRFAPLLFGARQHYTKIGHVVGIILVQLGGAAHVRQRFVRIIVAQERQALLELAKCFGIQHQFASRDAEEFWDFAARRKSASPLPVARAFLRGVPRMWDEPGKPCKRFSRRGSLFIPVREATRNACCNLLTGGPVLGQREKAVKKFCGWPCCRVTGTAQNRLQPAPRHCPKTRASSPRASLPNPPSWP